MYEYEREYDEFVEYSCGIIENYAEKYGEKLYGLYKQSSFKNLDFISIGVASYIEIGFLESCFLPDEVWEKMEKDKRLMDEFIDLQTELAYAAKSVFCDCNYGGFNIEREEQSEKKEWAEYLFCHIEKFTLERSREQETA